MDDLGRVDDIHLEESFDIIFGMTVECVKSRYSCAVDENIHIILR